MAVMETKMYFLHEKMDQQILLFCCAWVIIIYFYYLSSFFWLLFDSGITLTKLVGVIVLCFARSEIFVVSTHSLPSFDN